MSNAHQSDPAMHTQPITHCMNVNCGNELTFEEYRRQAFHCTRCERLRAAAKAFSPARTMKDEVHAKL